MPLLTAAWPASMRAAPAKSVRRPPASSSMIAGRHSATRARRCRSRRRPVRPRRRGAVALMRPDAGAPASDGGQRVVGNPPRQDPLPVIADDRADWWISRCKPVTTPRCCFRLRRLGRVRSPGCGHDRGSGAPAAICCVREGCRALEVRCGARPPRLASGSGATNAGVSPVVVRRSAGGGASAQPPPAVSDLRVGLSAAQQLLIGAAGIAWQSTEAVLPSPPRTVLADPLAVLLDPPVTELPSPLARLNTPSETELHFPLAMF
jgi:hypothetical protein